MKEHFNLWLSQRARLPGVLACGVCYPDHTSFTQQWADGFEPGPLEQWLACMADVWRLLQANGVSGRWLRWGYRHAWVYGVQRADGVSLGLIASRTATTSHSELVTTLLQDFLDQA